MSSLGGGAANEPSNTPIRSQLGCKCDLCNLVAQRLAQGVWVHYGCGKYESEAHLPIGKIAVNNLFRPNGDLSHDSSEHGLKPTKSIWFSGGTWLYDPYCEGGHNSLPPPSKSKVVVVRNPKKILTITNFEELNMFVQEYGIPIPDKPTKERHEKIKMLESNLLYRISKSELTTQMQKCCQEAWKISFEELETTMQSVIVEDLHFDDLVAKVMARSSNIKKGFEDYYRDQYHPFFFLDESLSLEEKICHFLRDNLFFLYYSYVQITHLKTIVDTFTEYPQKIRWQQIVDDGYWGVAFTFRKVTDLDGCDDTQFDNYYWHSGFDVETLVIFDTRALDDLSVEEVII